MNKFHYCTAGTLQRQFGFFVTGAGREDTKAGESYPHEYHSSDYYFTWKNGRTLCEWEYQLLYICRGAGAIEFKRGKPIALSAGSLVILHPGEWHRYRPNPKIGWSEAYIGFGGDFCTRILRPPFFPKPPVLLHIPVGGAFERELMSLVDDIQSTSTEQPYSLAMRTASLLATAFERTADAKPENTSNKSIRKAQVYIAHHLPEIIDFPALARQSKMSYALFRKRFKAYSGMAPLEFQLTLRIRRAASLLLNTELPISLIARDTGFRSPWYFSRFFRQETGSSPTEYRSRIKSSNSARNAGSV